MARADSAYFDQILDHLRQSRGFDFTAYKRSSLMRRLMKRMQQVGATTFEQYLDYVQVHQEEFGPLFNTILINVTSFFRDEEPWRYFASELLPNIIAERGDGEAIRIWSAGCASGQEAYTAAMVLAEQIGVDAVRERVKIYATDVDAEALAEARQAVYFDRELEDVPPAMIEKYFERSGNQVAFNRDLRRAVIFGRHDLVQDAPISRVDLLLCRNTLMYFNADAQSRILTRFYFSLNPNGYLMLGRAEMLFSHASMFAPVDLKRRVFKIVPRPTQRDRLLILTQTGRDAMASHGQNHFRVREAAFESDTVPQIVLDPANCVVAVNAPARTRFGIPEDGVGRPIQELDISYRPAELRAALDRVHAEAAEVTLKAVRLVANGEVTLFDVTVSPLFDSDRTPLGTRVAFLDVTKYHALQAELQQSKQELETAYEELQSTNEELETTNEELQSTVEELETTNEELQSTNEELETMNEELQSTNEELQTLNDELRNRTTGLNSVNAFLESVFASLQSAVIVLDHDYRVQVWNRGAEQLWGVRGDEAVQSNFLGLDIGLPLVDLKSGVRDVLSGAEDHLEKTLPAVNRRGKTIQCRVGITPLRHLDRTIAGVILSMEEVQDGP
ncbi:MAG TPA: CheR family methyltransferase [Vicinamibacterales bacterium]|jgi:two-component system CheB/CheR fusion protein